MVTVSISQIQLRRGIAADLPGAPTTFSPLAFSPGLLEGELGYTTDTGRLFVGIGSDLPVVGMPNYARSTFPYQNIEILTENSPLGAMLGGIFADNQLAFIQSLPLNETTTFQYNLQTSVAGVATDVHLDLGIGTGANAIMYYFMFDSSNNPIRQGQLNILWSTTMSGAPIYTDEAVSYNANIQWQATLVGSLGNQHVVLQYINLTGDTPTVYFRLDRPKLG